MSFVRAKNAVEYGDTVLLYIGYDNMLPVVVSPGQTHQTKFGAVKHSSLIGRQLGTRVECPKGWIYILNPTPELWTLSLPHRTQILYSTDISMIIFQLDLKPGSIVAEAGTGSGSLSHAIMRAIQPSGHLLTFEFHDERCQKAKEEFATHGLSSVVTVTHKDVCGEGFQLNNVVDAVFLDLPRPWECIWSSKNAIKKEANTPEINLLTTVTKAKSNEKQWLKNIKKNRENVNFHIINREESTKQIIGEDICDCGEGREENGGGGGACNCEAQLKVIKRAMSSK